MVAKLLTSQSSLRSQTSAAQIPIWMPEAVARKLSEIVWLPSSLAWRRERASSSISSLKVKTCSRRERWNARSEVSSSSVALSEVARQSLRWSGIWKDSALLPESQAAALGTAARRAEVDLISLFISVEQLLLLSAARKSCWKRPDLSVNDF